jgi:hypothetical protein
MTTRRAKGDNAPDSAEVAEVDRLRAENEALKQRLDRRFTWRKWLALLLVVLTTLAMVAATLAVWAHRTIFDTDTFMETVEPALDDPAFYAAVSRRVSDEILGALDIQTRVTDALTRLDEYLSETLIDALEVGERGRELLSRFDRPSLAALAPSVTEFLETRIVERTNQFVTSDEFRSAFPQLVRRAHEVSVALVRDDLAEYPNVYIESGEVRLNLIPAITEVLRRAAEDLRGLLPDIELPDVISDQVGEARQQLADAIQSRLPEDFGQVTIMSESALDEIQTVARGFDRMVWLLVIAAVLLAVLTILVSPARRRTALQLGLGVVVGLVIVMVVMRRVNAAILDQLTNPDSRQAAGALFAEVMSSLRALALIVGLAALVVAIGAYLAGRPAWVARVSDRTKVLTAHVEGGSQLDLWIAAHFDVLRLIGVGIAVVAVFLIGIELVPLLLIGAILVLYLWAISVARSRTLGEAVETEAVMEQATEERGK